MTRERSAGFEDSFLEIVEEQLNRCRARLIALEEDLSRLQVERAEEVKRVAQLEDLLHSNQPSAVPVVESSTDSAQEFHSPIAIADAPVEATDNPARVRATSLGLRPSRFEVPLPPTNLNRRMGLRDKAAEVLRQAGKPLHYTEITRQILRSGDWEPVTKTPGASVNSAMVIDIRDQGDSSTFVRVRRGVYGLREWKEDDRQA